MSILSLPQHRTKLRPGEAAIPCATSGPRHAVRASVGSELPDPRTKPIRFDDLPPADDHLLKARPSQHTVHVDPPTALCTVPLDGGGTHSLWDRQPRTLPALAASIADVFDDVELALSRLACALSDLAVRPGGVHALRMLLAPVMAYDETLAVAS